MRANCKKCSNRKTNEYYHNNKKKILEKQNRYYQNHKEERKEYNQKNSHKRWVYNTLRWHKDNNCQIDISIDELYKIAKNSKYCSICSCKLDWNIGNGLHNNKPTLDRINNEKILNKNNIWIICNRCNRTKSDRTIKEFKQYIELLYKKFFNKGEE